MTWRKGGPSHIKQIGARVGTSHPDHFYSVRYIFLLYVDPGEANSITRDRCLIGLLNIKRIWFFGQKS